MDEYNKEVGQSLLRVYSLDRSRLTTRRADRSIVSFKALSALLEVKKIILEHKNAKRA